MEVPVFSLVNCHQYPLDGWYLEYDCAERNHLETF